MPACGQVRGKHQGGSIGRLEEVASAIGRRPNARVREKPRTAEREVSLRQHKRNARVAEHPFRREVQRIKCNAICSLDGLLADP